MGRLKIHLQLWLMVLTLLLLLTILQDWTPNGAQSKEYAVGDHVKTAAGRQYVVVGVGTSKSTGSGTTHEGHPDKIDGTVKFRFAGVQDKATSVTDAKPAR